MQSYASRRHMYIVYVHFSKDFCLCIPYFTTYLHVGVIKSIGKYPACMYSVNLYLSGLGRLHIFCESTLQCTPLGDLDNVFWIVKYTILCIIFLIVWKLVSFCLKIFKGNENNVKMSIFLYAVTDHYGLVIKSDKDKKSSC